MVELGYTVRGGQGEDPELIHPGGSAVERLGEEYPYDARMSREECELEKYRLQVELLKFQYWGQDLDLKHVIVFEGRDAAGKGGTIKRFTEHLNPRSARAVALNKPSDREHGQWYFQRYTQHLPTAGEIVMFDRSWYNRRTSNRSWVSAPIRSTTRSWTRRRASRKCWWTPGSTSPSSGSGPAWAGHFACFLYYSGIRTGLCCIANQLLAWSPIIANAAQGHLGSLREGGLEGFDKIRNR
jgi:hypothetical protein